MARRRFFVESVHRGRAVLEGDEARHLRQVLRAEVGQRFELSDNRAVWLGEIESFGRDQVHFQVLEPVPVEPAPVRLHLLAALVKFDRFEWALEKATELGVERITPVQAERSERGLEQAARKRTERWRRILKESSQQSRRWRIPDLDEPATLEGALQTEGRCRLFLDEQPGAPPLLSAVPAERSASDVVCLLIGPEGGWTDAERSLALNSGWQATGLGPTILRAETAIAVSLGVVMAAYLVQSDR